MLPRSGRGRQEALGQEQLARRPTAIDERQAAHVRGARCKVPGDGLKIKEREAGTELKLRFASSNSRSRPQPSLGDLFQPHRERVGRQQHRGLRRRGADHLHEVVNRLPPGRIRAVEL